MRSTNLDRETDMVDDVPWLMPTLSHIIRRDVKKFTPNRASAKIKSPGIMFFRFIHIS